MNTCRSFRTLFSALLCLAAVLPGRAAPAAEQEPAKPAKPRLPSGKSVSFPKPTMLAAHEYLPTSKLKPGMKGYGLTVFKGTQIEKFQVTVLGVIEKANNGKDWIFVRVEGGPVTKRYANVAQGMSGSPVYVNGRIIGAVAYGTGVDFTREPLCFLTPIEDMLEAWDPDLPQAPKAVASAAAPAGAATIGQEVMLPAPIQANGESVHRIRIGAPGAAGGGVRNGTVTITPLMMPVSVSGVPLSRRDDVARRLSRFGLSVSPFAGGGAPPLHTKGSPMVPGGALGVSLATGDLNLTATGTITYRRGNKLVAFGHPFLDIGPIDAPMYSAYVHDVVPSYLISARLASPVDMVGRVFQDRPFSIGGELHAKPVMVPVAIHVDDRTTKRTRQYRANVVRHPMLTPVLASMAAESAIAEIHGQPGDSMARVSLEVEAEEVGKITRTNTFFDAVAISDAATSDLSTLLSMLSANPLYPVGVRSVKMSVVIEPGRDTAQVERIFLKQSRFQPGDTVDVGVVLKPYKRDRIVRNLQVRIPPSVPSGSLTLLVQGGGAGPLTLAPSATGGLVLRQGTDMSSATNLQQLVGRFTDKEKNNDLVARLLLPTSAITVQGEKLSSLPPAIADVMRSTRSTGLRVERDEVKTVMPTDYVLSGLQALTIRVARSSATERPTVSAPPPPDAGDRSLPSTTSSSRPTSIGGEFGDPDEDGGDGGDDGAFATPRMVIPAPRADAPAALLQDREIAHPPAAATGGEATPPSASPETKPGGDEKPAEDGKDAATPGGDASSPRPVGRMPTVWRQSSAADFRAGTLTGVTVTSLGDVRLAATLQKVAESNEAYFWSLAPGADKGVYAGTGDNGIVYKIAADGTRTEWAKTGELEVHALVRAGDGTVFAGTSPNGRVLKIAPDGKVSRLFQAEEKYVLALAPAPDGTLYAGTGGTRGRVYRIAPGGKGAVVYEGSETHVTALTLDAKGAALYAGTAPSGIVLRLTGKPGDRPTVLYDAGEPSITGLGVDKSGTVFAATGPRGMLYRIAPDASARVLYDKAPGAIAGVQVAADGTVWFASQSTVFSIAPNETIETYDAPSDIQILSLLLAPDGRLWASTGNVGAAYALGGGANPKTPAEGTLLSSVLDAKGAARWGTIRWTEETPAPSRVVLQTRTGDVAEPDETWSDWSRGYGHAAGETIVSPPGRYLQYRAILTGSDADSPALRSVNVFYLTRNQPPALTITVPRGGEVWRGAKTLRWSGSDPDKDTLTYDVSLSGDGGKTWQPVRTTGGKPLRSTPPPSPPSSPATPTRATPSTPQTREAQALADLRAELDKHPEIAPDVRARILTNAPAAIRDAIASSNRASGGSAAPAATPAAATRDTSLPLDTSRWDDGVYVLRVVASDAAANPQEGMRAERVSPEFRMVNQPPMLLLFSKATTVMSDRSVRIEGTAMHRLVGIRAVQFRVDNNDWIAAVAGDGLFDGQMEPFTLTTAPLSPGAHTIEVQAQDEAGNTATQKTTVRVR